MIENKIGIKPTVSKTDVELIEVQCGDYLGEDDIVRYEDVYGRVAASP